MKIHAPPLSDSLAAEYVLGTLHGAARRRFERLLYAHPGLRRTVADWERRLNRLALASPPVAPPPSVWRDLEQRLFPAPARRPWWDNLILWRGIALASLIAALLIVTPPLLPPPAADSALATIRGRQNEVLWTIAHTADGPLHVSNLRPMTIPPQHHCLLWLKRGQEPPVLLGILPDDGGNQRLTVPAELAEALRHGELWVTMQPANRQTPPARPVYQARWQSL